MLQTMTDEEIDFFFHDDDSIAMRYGLAKLLILAAAKKIDEDLQPTSKKAETKLIKKIDKTKKRVELAASPTA